MKSKSVFRFIFNAFLSQLPSPRFQGLKSWFLRRSGVMFGSRVVIDSGVKFYGLGEILIGDDTWIAHDVTIQSGFKIAIGSRVEVNFGTLLSANGGATLTIGDDCHIAHNVSLKCSTMTIDPTLSTGAIVGGEEFLDIKVGAGSWICAGAIILPGVSIGRYNIVAAGAVVTHSSEDDGVLLAGVPAMVKKTYIKVLEGKEGGTHGGCLDV